MNSYGQTGLILSGVAILGYSAYSLYRAGLCKTLKFDTRPMGPLKVAYKIYTGSYNESGTRFEEVAVLNNDPKSLRQYVGVYFDDPSTVPAGKARFAVGAVLLKGDDPSKLEQAGYKVVDMPKCTTIHTEFPFTGMLSIMVLLFVKKIYVRLFGHVVEQKVVKPEDEKYLICWELYGPGTADFHVPVSVEGGGSLEQFLLEQQPMDEYVKACLK